MCASVGARRAWDDEAARVSDGGVVWPSRRTEGCWDEACYSFAAGPVAALAAGDGERRGGRQRASSGRRRWREQPGARGEPEERQPWTRRKIVREQRKKDSGAPLHGVPNVGFRVPADP